MGRRPAAHARTARRLRAKIIHSVPKNKNPGRSRGFRHFARRVLARQLLLDRRLLLLRQLELRLRVADRSRGDFLRAHVLEYHQTVLRVFLGQAGAARGGSGDRGNRVGRRDNRRRVEQRARPAHVDAAVVMPSADAGARDAVESMISEGYERALKALHEVDMTDAGRTGLISLADAAVRREA